MTREPWVCLDCRHTGFLTVHGACSKCGSQAVALAFSLGEHKAPMTWVERAIEEAHDSTKKGR